MKPKTIDSRKLVKNKKILVTGGTGSIGRVLVKKLLRYEPSAIRILSRNATKQIELQNELEDNRRLRFLLGDVRDLDRVLMACEDIDIIFHAAAFKYVPQGEYNPFEVIQTNVMGTQNLISAALKIPSVTYFVMISTDKVVEPVSTMGASKLLAERLVSATHYMKGKKNKVFTTIRLGNVLGTSGSVLTLFHEQAKKGKIVLTHPDMVRFLMTVSDAVELIFDALPLARGGEIFVSKMPAVAIKDLAQVYVARSSHPSTPIQIGKIRPGEKLDESLLSPEETRFALETDTMFIVVPQIETGDIYIKDYSYSNARPLSSHTYSTTTAPRLPKKEIAKLLNKVEGM